MKNIPKLFLASFVFIFGLLFFSHFASAATYHVDAREGNDSWDGQSQGYSAPNHGPWKTIWKVNNSSFQPGDNIFFKRGEIWRELLRINWSGSEGRPITFGAYGSGEKPLFHGGTIINDKATGAENWTGPDANGIYKYSLGYKIGSFSEDSVVLPQATDKTLKDGNWFLEMGADHPYPTTVYHRPSSGVPADHVTDRNSRGTCIAFDAGNNSYVTIENIKTFLCVGVYATAANGPLHHLTVKNSDFDHSEVRIATRNGNDNSHITIKGNRINNGAESIYVGDVVNGPEKSSYVNISGNTIIDTGLLGGRHTGGDEEGIGLQNIQNGNISNNEIYGGAKGGGISYWTNMATVDATDNVMDGNYIHDLLGMGIGPGGSGVNNSSATVTNNIIARCGLGTPASYSPYIGGLRLNRAQSGTSLIANNTILDCDVGINMFSLTDNYIIRNNLVSGSRQAHIVRDEYGMVNNVLSNNLYYPNASNLFRYRSNFYDFSGWQNITHQDSNSTSSNPLFTNASGTFSQASDFQLKPGSPAIDAGANVGITKDYADTSVPQGAAPDIGAYERTSTSTFSSADINQDSQINLSDFNILNTDFLKASASLTNSRSDINADGQATVKDIGILMSGWH